MKFDTESRKELFLSRIEKLDGNGCWKWTRCKTKSGYGFFTIAKVSYYAHRLSWELHKGLIPEGSCVLHKCDNPPCVNPEHLFLGTKSDNSLDMWRKKRHSVPKGGHGKSGVPNVAWDRGKRKWRAQIYRPIEVFLGNYATVEEARLAVERYKCARTRPH